MRLPAKPIVIIGIGAIVLFSAMKSRLMPQPSEQHSELERNLYRAALALPTGFNTLFSGSGECELCHGKAGNGPNPTANQDADGNDVSPVSGWRATMMANSAKDPFWRAKVSHEVATNPGLQDAIETTCTSCHAPLGKFDALHNGITTYNIADMETDAIALDGVSCNSCHSMLADDLGNTFSGNLHYDTTHTEYGPFTNPFPNPMVMHTGFTPTYGQHINSSGMCGSCHTLLTNPVDSSGSPLGTQFVEQAVYQEWLNSDFPGNDQTCQSCHMPRINDGVVISDRPASLSARTPFGKHELVGGNAFMQTLLKNNIDDLGLAASEEDFDASIDRTLNMLQNQTLELELETLQDDADTARFRVVLNNQAGHKFPSGYPSRRAFVQFVATIETGDTLFASGMWGNDYELTELDANYEPHYAMIADDAQVQIYEMVMANNVGDVTTVLEYAYEQLKDNRLPPAGFSTSHNSYDTVAVVGNALADSDFNAIDGTAGSGGDAIAYHIPRKGYTGALRVEARVYYQSISPRWLEELFDVSTTEIDLFKSMYQASDNTPVLVAETSNIPSSIEASGELKSEISVWPNPSAGFVQIDGSNVQSVRVIDLNGKRAGATIQKVFPSGWRVQLPQAAGIYLLLMEDNAGKMHVEKVMRQ